MKHHLLPADTYIVINKTVLNEQDRKLITTLYQPIIGYSATSLYFTLVDDLDKRSLMSDDMTHHHLMSTMQLKLSDIKVAREKLEAVGLLKTYFKGDHINHYIYQLYSPMSASMFLNHPILNVVLYNNLGKKEYDKIVEYYKIPRVNLKEYEDITSSFSDVFTPVSLNNFIENDNIVDKNYNKLTLKSEIDFDLLISSIPSRLLNDHCFNEEVKQLINSLSYVYHIDNLNMQGLVRNCINEKGMIDKTELRRSCRNFYQYENNGRLPTLIYTKQPDYLTSPLGDNSLRAKMIYTFENTTPYDYLKSKYHGVEPSSRDLKLIESLLVDMKLKPGVVNVLISYVLKINHQKLNKNYIETIASSWVRSKIETVEDAMSLCEKEHKRLKKKLQKDKVVVKNKKEEKLPEWFNKNIEEESISKEEEQELEELLKEFN